MPAKGKRVLVLPEGNDTPAVDFSTLEGDLVKFQQDEVVQDALQRGVDLGQYARQVDTDLLALQASSIPDYIGTWIRTNERGGMEGEREGEREKERRGRRGLAAGACRELGGYTTAGI